VDPVPRNRSPTSLLALKIPKEVDLVTAFEKDGNELMKNQETEPQLVEVPKPPMKGKLFFQN
jgi:hypothetical protein